MTQITQIRREHQRAVTAFFKSPRSFVSDFRALSVSSGAFDDVRRQELSWGYAEFPPTQELVFSGLSGAVGSISAARGSEKLGR